MRLGRVDALFPYGRAQLVWNWARWWRRPRSVGPYPPSGPNVGAIYTGWWVIGPLQIRQWAPAGYLGQEEPGGVSEFKA